MFAFAMFLGVFYFTLFFFGVFGLFYKNILIAVTVFYFLFFVIILRKQVLLGLKQLTSQKNIKKIVSTSKIQNFFVVLLVLQGIVNFIGVLGPELSFDALWYHLTLPKLYLLHNAIYHIPGGLLYYSDMPKLGELFYAVALSFGDEITAKMIHFTFSILSSIALYLFARKYLNILFSTIAVIIFYSNLVVAWESTTAYIDLIRTFFEIMALWSFMNWTETLKRKWLMISAFMLGMAITTKLLAFGSLIIFSILLLYILRKASFKNILSQLLLFWTITLLIPLPWFIFSYIHTANPVYPFFSDIYKVIPEPLSLFGAAKDIWLLFTHAADPISPLYLIFLPLVIITYKYLNKSIKLVIWYSLLAIIIWYLTPRTGGGRFMMPYLPAMSVVCSIAFYQFIKTFKLKKSFIYKFLISLTICVAFLSISYRFIANKKYIPVIIGQTSKHDFLANNLNYSFGDFYDADNYFSSHIKPTDKVLLNGFHNLYYVEFPFTHATWAVKGEQFDYIAVQKAELPENYKDWQLVYKNVKTMVKLYKPTRNNQ